MNSINSHGSPCQKVVKNHSNARWYETESILTATLQKCEKNCEKLGCWEQFDVLRIPALEDCDRKWIGS